MADSFTEIPYQLTPQADVVGFEAGLKASGQAFLGAQDQAGAVRDVQFTGCFEGAACVWNARIWTMQAYAGRYPVAPDPLQFIEINFKKDFYFIEIGLNLGQIDDACIERTIIMVRNYRRLRLGRHEYGARSKTQ